MASRRWIPVLASVLVLVAIGVGVLALLRFAPELVLGRLARYKPPVVIAVEGVYPGANAEVVAQTVAIPVEQQVNGVENMVSMSSQCSNDGRYVLHVTFANGTDPNMAQVLVQNRTSLAAPVLPATVQQAGMTVRKVVPQPIALVCLTSPDKRFDERYLGNFAAIQIQPELARVAGIGEVVPFGASEQQHRLLIDPLKLRSYQLSLGEVLQAIRKQTAEPQVGPLQPAPVEAGQPAPITVHMAGRLASMDQFGDIVLKENPDGNPLRLLDVARIDLGGDDRSRASLNGQPALVLAIYPLPEARASDVSRAITEKLAELRPTFPEGLADATAFDFAPNVDPRAHVPAGEHLVIDVELPAGATPERIVETLRQAVEVIQKTPDVQDVLALTEHPSGLVRARPCLIVGLTPTTERKLDRTAQAAHMRSSLTQAIAGAEFRFSVPAADGLIPVYGFPIEFVIEDRADHPVDLLLDAGRALVKQMEASGKFSDVAQTTQVGPVPMIDVDQAKCLAAGIDMTQVFEAAQLCVDPVEVGSLDQFGRTWKVQAALDDHSRDAASRLQNVWVKNQQRELVPLASVATIRQATGRAVVERHNLYPATRVTANLASGVPLAEGRQLCESLAARELGVSFKLVWLSASPLRR